MVAALVPLQPGVGEALQVAAQQAVGLVGDVCSGAGGAASKSRRLCGADVLLACSQSRHIRGPTRKHAQHGRAPHRTAIGMQHITAQDDYEHFQVAGVQAGIVLERLLLDVPESVHVPQRCKGGDEGSPGGALMLCFMWLARSEHAIRLAQGLP